MIYTYMFLLAKTDRIEERNELEIENSTIIARDFNTPF